MAKQVSSTTGNPTGFLHLLQQNKGKKQCGHIKGQSHLHPKACNSCLWELKGAQVHGT